MIINDLKSKITELEVEVENQQEAATKLNAIISALNEEAKSNKNDEFDGRKGPSFHKSTKKNKRKISLVHENGVS